MKAIWNGAVLAESDDTVIVERNHYFPVESLQNQLFIASNHTSICPWKVLHDITRLKLVGKSTKTQLGITQSRLPPPPRLVVA